jgi:ribosomal protein S14
MARTSRTNGLRDRDRRCGLRLAVVRRAGFGLAALRLRLGATNGGLRRPELLMLALPGHRLFAPVYSARCQM